MFDSGQFEQLPGRHVGDITLRRRRKHRHLLMFIQHFFIKMWGRFRRSRQG